MKFNTLALLALSATCMAFSASANEASPTGLWKNIDDSTGKPRGMIRITEANGKLQGKIEKVFPAPNEDANPTCKKCEGALKDAPVIGLTILSDLSKEGDKYTGGQILDPDNGKTYRSQLRLVENGKKLEVRGYIGTPLLGRSQTWVREE